jgi:hypothetical protein
MSIKIELPLELEKQLEANAKVLGLSAEEYVLLLIKNDIKTPEEIQRRQELMLLQQINQGLEEEVWVRYFHLMDLREQNIINQEEYEELLNLTETVEQDHAERINKIAHLAKIRQVDIKTLMNELGISPRKYVAVGRYG